MQEDSAEVQEDSTEVQEDSAEVQTAILGVSPVWPGQSTLGLHLTTKKGHFHYRT